MAKTGRTAKVDLDATYLAFRILLCHFFYPRSRTRATVQDPPRTGNRSQDEPVEQQLEDVVHHLETLDFDLWWADKSARVSRRTAEPESVANRLFLTSSTGAR